MVAPSEWERGTQLIHDSGRLDWFAPPYEPTPRPVIEEAVTALLAGQKWQSMMPLHHDDTMIGPLWLDREGRAIDFAEATVRYFASDNPAFEGRMIAQSVWPDGAYLSTVFLCVNHAFTGGPPVAWETMLFPDPARPGQDNYCERYTSELEARAGHVEAIAAYEKGELA